jgi:integrase
MRRSNGSGSIYRRKDGRWCASVYNEKDGKLSRQYVYGKTQKEVRAKLKELEEQLRLEKEQRLHPLLYKKFSDWVSEYLEVYKKPVLKQTTYDTYQNFYEKHILHHDIGNMALGELSTEYLQSYYHEKQLSGLSAKTIHHIHVIINGSLTKAFQLGYIEKNICDRVVLPKKEKYTGKSMKLEDARRFICEAKEERIYPIVVVAMLTGLRKGEIFGLQWKDIDFDNRILYVRRSLCRLQEKDSSGKTHSYYEVMEPKTAKSKRSVPLSQDVINAFVLQQKWQDSNAKKFGDIYSNPDGFIFTQEDGSFLSQKGFLEQFYRVLDKYSIPRLRFHDLRHTFASLLLESGENMKTIQELLGHSQISTTMDIYTHFSEKMKRTSIGNLERIIKSDDADD